MSRMSPGTEAKKKADRDRYHADPERFKKAAQDKYDSDPEVFRIRSRRNRLLRTDEQKANHLGYSRNYYLENAVELRTKKTAYYAANKDQINGRRRYLRLEAKKQERFEQQRLAEEEARLAKKKAKTTITQIDVADAVAKFLKDGGKIQMIKTEYQAPTTGLVGIKTSRG